jgi:putative flippase GtrA
MQEAQPAKPRGGLARLPGQTVKYLTVGLIAGLSDITVLALLSEVLSVSPLHANLVSRPLGGLVSFVLNKYWTFANQGRAPTHRQLFRYACIWLVCFAGSESLLGLYLSLFELRPSLAKLAAECTLGVFSFLSQRYWTFR